QLEKQPTAKWRRDEIQVWLEKNNVDFKRDSFKAVLLELCRANKKPIKYVIDELLAKNTDHIINRLPAYHCFYNPIELVQGLVKRYFDKHVGLGHDYSEDSMLISMEKLC
ncbi:GSCOCG00011958001-RA-CDS, partial [Cotesia congregata]